MMLERTFGIANCIRLPEVKMALKRTVGKVKMLGVSNTISKALAEGFRDTSHAECPSSGSTEIWPAESRRNPLAEP